MRKKTWMHTHTDSLNFATVIFKKNAIRESHAEGVSSGAESSMCCCVECLEIFFMSFVKNRPNKSKNRKYFE